MTDPLTDLLLTAAIVVAAAVTAISVGFLASRMCRICTGRGWIVMTRVVHPDDAGVWTCPCCAGTGER